ncbi:hypothetical protein L596_010428 [Steinernema carpocapsae]|uniref:Sodium-dependent multivitamin transporter n=1 Tax=Steinernema carpocapsae TaxID=34508 RepID=A0A4U5PJ22_STECR|nr:hypothetical protein L596_010428 [Steinernema carpocapsae]
MENVASTYSLTLLDYIVFGGFLCISVGVGIYYALLDIIRKHLVRPEQSSTEQKCKTEEYLLGGRQMPIVPVALSLLTTFLSGITLLGTPAEIFKRGGLWALGYFVAPLAFIITGFIFIPIFFELKTTSVYEYLELRFHSAMLRRLCAGAFVVNTLVYLGAVTYAPAVALNGITNLEVWILILLVGVSSTLYTTLGGLKAVVWTDTLQAGVMYAGIGFIVIKGTIDCGGVGRVFEVVEASGRIENTMRFDLNPAQYHSVWVACLSTTADWMALYGFNQMSIQRYCSLPSVKDGKFLANLREGRLTLFQLKKWFG